MKICSSGSIENLLNLIKEFYISENIIIEGNKVRNTKLYKELGYITLKRGRYTYYVD